MSDWPLALAGLIIFSDVVGSAIVGDIPLSERWRLRRARNVRYKHLLEEHAARRTSGRTPFCQCTHIEEAHWTYYGGMSGCAGDGLDVRECVEERTSKSTRSHACVHACDCERFRAAPQTCIPCQYLALLKAAGGPCPEPIVHDCPPGTGPSAPIPVARTIRS